MAMYNPRSGRFLSRDPRGKLGFERTQNRFRRTAPISNSLGSNIDIKSLANRMRGKIFDRKSSLNRNRAFSDLSNIYSFVGNDPQNNIDILGLQELHARCYLHGVSFWVGIARISCNMHTPAWQRDKKHPCKCYKWGGEVEGFFVTIGLSVPISATAFNTEFTIDPPLQSFKKSDFIDALSGSASFTSAGLAIIGGGGYIGITLGKAESKDIGGFVGFEAGLDFTLFGRCWAETDWYKSKKCEPE